MPKKSKKHAQTKNVQPFIVLGLLFVALIIIVFQVTKFQQTHTNALSNCTVSSTDLTQDTEEQKLLQLVNTYRQQHNLQPLKLSINLTRGAAWLSNDMAAKNYLNHTDSLGRLPDQRLTDCGYSTFNIANGENIAGDTLDANSTFTQWKNSPVHNANMLQANFVVAGIARTYNANATLKWYWTLDFGGQDDSNITPTQTQPSQTIVTPTPPYATPSYVCAGSANGVCPTPTIPIVATPTIETVQPTDTHVPSSINTSEIPTISQTPISTIPTPRGNTNALLALLLSIITFILDLFRKLL
jgi:uncharacterized protein YkwD